VKSLIIDVETTGLAVKKEETIEIGAALYDTELKVSLWQYGRIIHTEKENGAEFINKISREALDTAKLLGDPIKPVQDLLETGQVDIIMAHNKNFDMGFVIKKWGIIANPNTGNPIPWICTKEDITFPNTQTSRKLGHLAWDHDILTNVKHRALHDVLLVVELLKKVPDLDEQIRIALEPRKLFRAITSYDERDKAKKAGFSWNRGDKRWEKALPEDTHLDATEDRPFRVVVVGDVPTSNFYDRHSQ